jgi:hypothetical protein
MYYFWEIREDSIQWKKEFKEGYNFRKYSTFKSKRTSKMISDLFELFLN